MASPYEPPPPGPFPAQLAAARAQASAANAKRIENNMREELRIMAKPRNTWTRREELFMNRRVPNRPTPKAPVNPSRFINAGGVRFQEAMKKENAAKTPAKAPVLGARAAALVARRKGNKAAVNAERTRAARLANEALKSSLAYKARVENEAAKKRAAASRLALATRLPPTIPENEVGEAAATITERAISKLLRQEKLNKEEMARLRAAEAASTPQGAEAFMNTIRRLASRPSLNATNLAQAKAALNAYNKSTKYRPRVFNKPNVKTLRNKIRSSGWTGYMETARPRAVAARQAPRRINTPRRQAPNIGGAVANAVTQAIKAATTPAAAKKFVQTTPPAAQRRAFTNARGNVPQAVAKAMNPNDLAKAIVAAIEAGVKKIAPEVVAPALAPPTAPANSRAVAKALDAKALAEAVVEAIRQGVKVRPEVMHQQQAGEMARELQKAAPNTGRVANNVARAIENAVRAAARPGPAPSANKKSWRNWIPSFGFGGGAAAQRQAAPAAGGSFWNLFKRGPPPETALRPPGPSLKNRLRTMGTSFPTFQIGMPRFGSGQAPAGGARREYTRLNSSHRV